MTIPADQFHKVQNADPLKIFAVIVDQYGRKMADDIALRVASNAPGPVVQWPSY